MEPEHSAERSQLETVQSSNSWMSLVRRHALLSISGLILVCFIILLPRYQASQRSSSQSLPQDYLGNVLVVVDAQLDSNVAPSSITLKFNHPVEPHAISHAFTLIPPVPGEWVADKDTNTIVHYAFAAPYKGEYLSLYLTEGLTSENHKTLLETYQNFFVLSKPTAVGNEYSPMGRVETYAAGVPIPFYSDLSTATVYRSNTQKLLEFLRYSLPPDVARGSIYDGTYLTATMEHPKSDKVTQLNVDTQKKTISLDPGVYYVEPIVDSGYFIVVSTFGAVLRQDDKKVALAAFNYQDGTAVTDSVTYGFYNLHEGVKLIRDVVQNSPIATYDLRYPTRLDAVIAIHKNEVAFIPVEAPSSLAEIQVYSDLDTETKVFIYTDRPIYKPGDTVFVRGIIRQDSDAQYAVPPVGKTMYLAIEDGGKESLSTTTPVDEFGTFSTQFVLPKEYAPSYSYIKASLQPFSSSNYRTSYASFEVMQYVKPDFEIKTAVDKSEYLRSDKLKFVVRGNYFDGQPLKGKEIAYSLFTDNYYEVEKAVFNKNFSINSPGGMCGGGGDGDYMGEEYQTGKVTLNDAGEAVLEVSPNATSILSQKITLLAKVTDSKNNQLVSAVTTIVHDAQFNIFFIPSADRYAPGEEIVAPFYVETLTGEKLPAHAFSYDLIFYDYSGGGSRATQKSIISGTTNTDENGKGIVKFTVPQDVSEGYHQLIVSALDANQNTAENQKSITISKPEAAANQYATKWGGSSGQTFLKIASSQNSFKVGDTISLTIESPSDLDILLTFERGRMYDPQVVHLGKGSNTVQFKVGADLSPSISLVFSFFYQGKYYSEGLSLNVPAMHKLLQVDMHTDKAVYAPNETAELIITTRDAQGAPVPAQLSVGIVDKAIYALRESATPPLHSSFYYFRPRRTNASSSLTGMGDWGGRGGGGGGMGGGGPASAVDVLYWNPTVKTDASGEVRIPVPLMGYQTIWKAQALGSTLQSEMGQNDIEFTVKASQ